MRITNPKTTLHSIVSAIISGIAVLIALFCFNVAVTSSSAGSNPPHHWYGGFDFELWWTGAAELVGALLLVLLVKRSSYGNRYVLLGAATAIIMCILFHITMLLFYLGRPPV